MSNRKTQFPLPKSELFWFDETDGTFKPMPTDKDGRLEIAGYDEVDDALKMKSMQSKWRAGFTGTELNPNKWEVVKVGTGQSLGVNNGTLQINAGTTPNAETVIISKQEFTIPMRFMMNVALSQRIANQEFFIELVSVDKESGEPNSHSCAGWLFDGTSATTAKYYVNGGDQPVLYSSATTVLTTASAGNIFEVEPTSDEVWFFGRALDSTNGRSNSFVRQTQIPNPNLKYKLQIRVVNGATAPASNTVFSSQFANVSDYAELTAEITAGRGGSVAGQAIAVTPTSLPTLATVTTAYIAPKAIYQAETVANINASATFTGTIRDISSTMLYGIYRLRATCANNAIRINVFHGSSATLTSNKIQQTFTVEAGQMAVVDIPLLSRYVGIQVVNLGATTATGVEVLSALLGTT